MFCKFCGSMIDDDARFCSSCGKKATESQPNDYINTEAKPPIANWEEAEKLPSKGWILAEGIISFCLCFVPMLNIISIVYGFITPAKARRIKKYYKKLPGVVRIGRNLAVLALIFGILSVTYYIAVFFR